MKHITATDTLELSVPERIQLVEDIWDTISSQPEAVDLSEEDKKIIDARLEAYHRDPAQGAPWKDVYQKITSRQ